MQHTIYIIAALFSVALFSANFAQAQTLDAETVKSLINGFNPAVGPIPTKSYMPPSGCAIPAADNSTGTINKIQCGLYASDPLNNETKTYDELKANNGNDYWFFGGSADTFTPPAPTDYFKDSDGLHIGVQSPANGTYAGYYAVSPNTNGMLFHAQISSPLRTTPSEYFQNGIYVQTSQDPINYIACVSITNNVATLWAVVHTYSSPFQALVFDTLYVDTSADQPLTRDCTIVTNGSNYLEVYMDNTLVYSSDALALAMPAPFIFFLEPQTSYDDQMLYGTYRDYYATTEKNIRIENIPQNATSVQVVDNSGAVLESVPPVLGTARIDVAKYHYPLDAYIKAYDANDAELAATPVSHTVYGGDVYSVVGPSMTDNASDTVGAAIDAATQEALSAINDSIQRLTSTVDNATQVALATINETNQTAISTIDDAKQQVSSTIVMANQTAISAIDDAAQTATTTLSTANQTATSTADQAKQQATSALAGANQTLASTIDNTMQQAISAIDNATKIALATINETNQTGTSTIALVNQTATTSLDQAKRQASSAISTANQTAISAIDDAKNTALSTIDDAMQQAISAINETNQTASSAMDAATHQLVPLTIRSDDMNGAEFEGMSAELWRNGTLIQQGYTPFSTYVQNGAEYQVFMNSWNNITFDHWDDGSTDPWRTFTPTKDTAFTAFFRIA